MWNTRVLLRRPGFLPAITVLIMLTACEEKKAESVAEQMIGRWGIENTVQVTIRTDFCTDTLEAVATEEWTSLIWDINETSDDHVVQIAMTYYPSNFTVTNNACLLGTGYVPEPSPIFLTGYIDNQTVTVMYGDDEVGVFTYIEDSMSGDLTYGYCLIYCQEITTEPTGMITLTKL